MKQPRFRIGDKVVLHSPVVFLQNTSAQKQEYLILAEGQLFKYFAPINSEPLSCAKKIKGVISSFGHEINDIFYLTNVKCVCDRKGYVNPDSLFFNYRINLRQYIWQYHNNEIDRKMFKQLVNANLEWYQILSRPGSNNPLSRQFVEITKPRQLEKYKTDNCRPEKIIIANGILVEIHRIVNYYVATVKGETIDSISVEHYTPLWVLEKVVDKVFISALECIYGEDDFFGVDHLYLF